MMGIINAYSSYKEVGHNMKKVDNRRNKQTITNIRLMSNFVISQMISNE